MEICPSVEVQRAAVSYQSSETITTHKLIDQTSGLFLILIPVLFELLRNASLPIMVKCCRRVQLLLMSNSDSFFLVLITQKYKGISVL